MVERTGLNIKDYPFAFSIVAIFYPNLIVENTNSTPIIGILLIGGMIGSLLTITNPVGRIISHNYNRGNSEQIDYILFPDFFPHVNELIKRIIQTNFRAALTSPAISFENDKIVSMIYFIIILTATFVRSFFDDFQNILNNDQIFIWGIRSIVIVGLIGVLMVLLNHTYGINFKTVPMKLGKKVIMKLPQKPNLSQFDRICCVTLSNLALDFANLSNEGAKWGKHGTNDYEVRSYVLKRFLKINKQIEMKLSHGWTTSFDDFQSKLGVDEMRNLYAKRHQSWNDNTDLQDLYQKYKSTKEISLKYGAGFAQTLSWFENLAFFNPMDLYDIEQQLKNTIESRDWYSADLMKYRVTDKVEAILREKNMPELIDDK